MAKSFSTLKAKLPPDVLEKAKAQTRQMLEEMALQELREARKLSQVQIARSLNIKQPAVSKLEKRTDMYISTLRGYVESIGGKLEIVAHLPEGDVVINQFNDLGIAQFRP